MYQLVSNYLGTLLNVLSVLVFSRLVLKENVKISKKRLLLLVLIIALGLQMFYYFNITVLKTFALLIVFGFLYKFIYRMDMTKAIILDFFYIIIEILSDMFMFEVFTSVMSEEKFYSTLSGSLLGNVAVLGIMVLLTLLVRKIIYKFLNAKIKYRMIFFLVVSVLCIISIFYATFKLGTNSVDQLLGLSCIAIIVTVLCYSFNQTYKNNQLTLEYDNLLSFIKKYEVEIDNQRIMRHETKNQLLTIKAKIIDKEKDTAVINYIDEIIRDGRKVKHSEYAKLKYLPSNGIKGLLYFKISYAQDMGINVGVNISKNIENSFLYDLDSASFNQIGKVLGVYLDNATESANVSREKMMGIEIFPSDDEIVVIISNSYDSKVKTFGRSSKGWDRGYGLLLANNIINSNAKLSTSTEITDKIYVKKLVIKK